MAKQNQKAIDVKRKHEDHWMNMEGVVAVGVGLVEGKAGIIISVKGNPELFRKQIPSGIEGVKITVRQTGEIRAQ